MTERLAESTRVFASPHGGAPETVKVPAPPRGGQTAACAARDGFAVSVFGEAENVCPVGHFPTQNRLNTSLMTSSETFFPESS